VRWLLDTCVISELARKQQNFAVVRWIEEQTKSDLFLSVLTMGELHKGSPS